MSQPAAYRYLTQQMVDRLGGVELGVRRPMDGSHQGMHRSPAFGSSVEFAEYRDYVAGDPITQIDWPVYARTDHYVIRKYHEDVSIRCYILLDTSESMKYRQKGPMSKAEYGCYIAAGLMYLMTGQGDTVSLITFDNEIREYYEPAGSFAGLRPMLLGLEKITPKGKSDIEASLHAAAELIRGRALVVVISDLLTEPDSIMRGLNHLYHDGKEVTVFHVLDPAELHMPGTGLVEVVALETNQRMTVDWGQIREAYFEQLNLYLDELRKGCQNIRADYVLVDTRTEVYDAILRRSRMR